MYAHQILDDLQYVMQSSQVSWGSQSIKKDYFRLCEQVVSLINKSQHFHIGDAHNLVPFQQHNTTPLFSEQETKQLPYDYCLFEYNRPSKTELYATKIALLVHEYITTEGRIWEVIVLDNRNKGHWFFAPVSAVIIPDQTIYGSGNISFKYLPSVKLTQSDYYDEIEDSTKIACILLNITLRLLHCKNISYIENAPDDRLNKKRIKRGKTPLFTYHTLIITPFNSQTKSQHNKNIWANRVHLCRGHFKRFTSDKPLFGKYTGMYWWQPMVRGKNHKGVVVKDYFVK